MAIRFSILFLLLCSAAFAANLPPEQATSSPGSAYVGQGTQSPTPTIPLSAIGASGTPIFLDCGYENTATNGDAQPCRQNGTLYQVPSGKTLTVLSECAIASTASLDWQWLITTATFGKDTGLGSLTGPVYQTGLSSGAANISFTSAHVPGCDTLPYQFLQSTWPGLTSPGTGNIIVHVTGWLTTP